ncbi:MAG: hypothetical protein ACXABI_00230 [Candidatus Hodarchaeales archaeon]|jgi:hypothetical protein
MFRNYKEMDYNQKIRFILIFYVIAVGFIYSMLVIFFRESFFIPAFDSDFNRSLIFLTLLLGALLYSEEFEVIIGVCFIGPTLIYSLAAILSIALSFMIPDTDPFFAFVGSITISLSYFFIASIGGLVMNTVSNWIATKFRVVKTISVLPGRKKDIFSVISENGNNHIIEQRNLAADSPKTHSRFQIIGITLLQISILLLSSLLLFLPIYDYGFGSHLNIFDLGLVPLLLLLIVMINAVTLIFIILIDSVKPVVEEFYPKRIIKFQSICLGVGYFIVSLFFPNPSFRVENYVVTSGIGIEFLSYAMFLSFLITPALIEYLNYVPKKETAIL